MVYSWPHPTKCYYVNCEKLASDSHSNVITWHSAWVGMLEKAQTSLEHNKRDKQQGNKQDSVTLLVMDLEHLRAMLRMWVRISFGAGSPFSSMAILRKMHSRPTFRITRMLSWYPRASSGWMYCKKHNQNMKLDANSIDNNQPWKRLPL